MIKKQYKKYLLIIIFFFSILFFSGKTNALWNQWYLINSDFWATNPSNTQIASALFGTGTPIVRTSYTKIWDNYTCSSLSVQTINPWTNTLPVSLAANTIYVLNSWNYIINAPRSFAGNCTAIIGKWEVTIFSSLEISQMLAATWTARNNIIVDNIKFDGKNNGAWWTHVLTNKAIDVPYWYNVTIHNSQFYNFKRPLYFWYGINALYNSQIFNNDDGGSNLCQTSWSWTEQPMINAPWHLNINNCLIFNNNNSWLLWTSKSIVINNTQIFNNKRSTFFGKSVTTEWAVFNNVMIYNNLIWLRLDFDYTIFNDVYLFNNNHKYNSIELWCWTAYSTNAIRNYYAWSKSFYTTKNGEPTLKIFNHFNSNTNFSSLANGEDIEDYNFSKDEGCWVYFSLDWSWNSLLCSVVWNSNYVTNNVLWWTDNIAMNGVRWNLLYWEDAVLFWNANVNSSLFFGCHMLTQPINTLTWLYKWASCNKNLYDGVTAAEKERNFSLAFQKYWNRDATPIIRFTYGGSVLKQKNPVYWKTWSNNMYWAYTWLFYYWVSGSDWDNQKYIGEVQRIYPNTTTPVVNNNYRWYKIMWINIFWVINTGQFWYVSTNASFQNVREFGICKTVVSSANQIFIPTKTSSELNSFLTYTPLGVLVQDCDGCYNDTDCLPGQTCQWETTWISPYCQGTFSVPTTTYSCQSNWVATPSCWKNGYQILAGDIDDCTIQWGTPGFYFKWNFYDAMMACMMDESSNQRSDLICPYPCSSLAQSQCIAPECNRTSSTTNQIYNCNQPITTTTARCVGKEVPLSEQYCYDTSNWDIIAASDYWECQILGYSRWFYFNSTFYNASSMCMMEAWEGWDVQCFYPCRWLTQSQCTAKPTQCSRTTATTTVSPNECWDRSGCSRNPWSAGTAGTCTSPCDSWCSATSLNTRWLWKTHYIEWASAWKLLDSVCGCFWVGQRLKIYNASNVLNCNSTLGNNRSVEAVCNGNNNRSFPNWDYTNTYTVPCVQNINDPNNTNVCVQSCWTANGQSYSSLTSTSSNLCNMWNATSFTTLTSSWSWMCWTASCSAMKTLTVRPCDECTHTSQCPVNYYCHTIHNMCRPQSWLECALN